MPQYFTSGQVAKKLHVSISTLKRWLGMEDLKLKERRNINGWRLFTETDIDKIKDYKKKSRKKGKRFNETTLIPVQKD